MPLDGLRLARDGIGYGTLAIATDGVIAASQGNLTICPPNLNSYSIDTFLDSLQIGLQIQSIDTQSIISYLEYILQIDSVDYILAMSSTICPPSLVSYESGPTIDSVSLNLEITSGEFYFIVDSIEYLIEVNSADIKPSGFFELCEP